MRRAINILYVASAVLAATPVRAQDWPSRSITMVVPYAAGGPTDAVGRILAQGLGEALGRPVVVENVAGAGGMTGSARVVRAAPDGYEILFGGAGTQTYNQLAYKKPLYNSRTDFTPVGLMTEQAVVLITRKDLPTDDLPGFVAYARSHKDMRFGSGGTGSTSHFGCLLLNHTIGAEATHVPYRGAGPAMQDLIAGRIDYLCDIVQDAVAQIGSGTVKAVATLGRERSPALPGLATAQEQGVAIDATSWYGLFLPKGVPAAIVEKLRAAAARVLDTASVRERLRMLGVTVVPPERRGADYYAQFLDSDLAKWSGPIQASGITFD